MSKNDIDITTTTLNFIERLVLLTKLAWEIPDKTVAHRGKIEYTT